MSDSLLLQPQNSSLLQSTKFQLSFKRMPAVVYFCQSVNLPGMNVSLTEQPTPFRIKPIPGNKLDYEYLTIEFLLEEEMVTWKTISDWMKAIGLEKSTEDYSNLGRKAHIIGGAQQHNPGVFSDATLTTLSVQNNPKNRFIFKDCFPINLSGIDFDTKKSPADIMTCTAKFAFESYDME